MEWLRETFGLVCGRYHCWTLGGVELPFCQRCTGLYVGAAAAVVLYAVFRPRPTYVSLAIHGLLLLLMVPFGYHLVPQNDVLRTLTGQLFAVGLVCYLWMLPASRLGFPNVGHVSNVPTNQRHVGNVPHNMRVRRADITGQDAKKGGRCNSWAYAAGVLLSLGILQACVHLGGRAVGVVLAWLGFLGLLALAVLVAVNLGLLPGAVWREARSIRRSGG